MKTSLCCYEIFKTKVFRIFTISMFTIFGNLLSSCLAQNSQTFNADGTFNVPAGVTEITVECWGGGGKGGTRTSNGVSGGGGGGGYSRSVLTVVPSNSYTVSVGAGATGTSAGGDSWFGSSSTILARGGNSVSNNNANGASGGAVGIGDVTYSGGDGHNGNTSGTRYGGGGGSSAGIAANGTDAPNQNGGNAPAGGGNGGNGRYNSQGNGSDGDNPGGGGGGAVRTSSYTRSGGDGARGRVIVSWIPAYSTQFISMDYGNSPWCAGETRNVSVTVKNIGQASWTNSSPDINVGVKWNQNGTSWADYYVRTDANNVAPGATATFTLPLTASNYIAGTGYTTPLNAGINNISFDMVVEGVCWFGNNNVACGPGNAVFVSPNIVIANPINITTHPSTVPQTYCVGDNAASLSISATGTSPAYQWYVNSVPSNTGGTIIPGATSQTYVPSTSSAGVNYYYCVVTGCDEKISSVSGAYTVNGDATLTLTTAPSTITQTICFGNAMANIEFAAGGAAIGVTISSGSVPPGVSGSFSGGVYTLTGTPSVTGIYTFTVSATGSVCINQSQQVTLTVSTPGTILLTSAASTDVQTLCVNSPLTDIEYTVGGGATGAVISSGVLPAGVTGSFSSGVFTISGTPTESGIFNFQITTTGDCVSASLSASITVNPAPSFTLASGVGSNNPTLCINTVLNDIIFSLQNETGVSVTGLPSGLSGAYNSGTFTISGTPTQFGSFPYTITANGGCGTSTTSGTITVNNIATLSLTSGVGSNFQTACVTQSAITNITYSVGGSGTGATVTGLPTGISGSYNSGIFTISGTPNVTGVFNYTVTATGGSCVKQNETGTITVVALPVANAITGPNEVCAINQITLLPNASGIGQLTYSWTSSNPSFATVDNAGVVTGVAAGTVNFFYTVTNGSGCTRSSANFSVTVKAAAVGNLTASETSGIPNDNIICPGSNVTFVATTGYPNYHFKVNGVTAQNSNARIFNTTSLQNGDVVTVEVTNINGCITTYNSITISVTPAPVGSLSATENSGTTANDNIICAGDNVIFTATPGFANYIFKVNGGDVQSGASNTFTTSSLSGTASVTVVASNSAGCASVWGPQVITVGANPTGTLTASENSGMAANDNSICVGDAVTFSAPTGFNMYSFLVNGLPQQTGVSNSFVSTSLTNPSIVAVQATSATGCVGTFAPVVITVNDLPSGTLTATENSGTPNDNIICAGASITFFASSGYSQYQFKINGVPAQTGPSSTFTSTSINNGDVISVDVTSSAGCFVTFNSLNISVTALPSTVLNVMENSGTTGNDGVICAGDNITFIAEAGHVNYRFYLNNVLAQVGTSNTYSTTSLANNDVVHGEILDINGCEVLTNSITVSVVSLPMGSIVLTENSGIAANDDIICDGYAAIFTATSGYVNYNFFVNGLSKQSGSSNVFVSSTLADGDIVTVSATNVGGCEQVFNNILVTVKALPSGTLSATENSGTPNDNIICPNEQVTFTATAGWDWYDFKVNGTSVQASSSNTYIASDINSTTQVTVVISNSNGCTLELNTIMITVLPAPVGILSAAENSGIASNDNIICSGASVTFTATSGYQHYEFFLNNISVQSSSSNIFSSSALADGDVVSVEVLSNNGCSLSYNTVVITVHSNPVQQPITGNPETCVNTSSNLYNSNPGGVWSSTNSTVASIHAATGVVSGHVPGIVTITYSVTNVNGCTTLSTTPFEVYALPVPTLTGPNPFCPGTTAEYLTESGQFNYVWTITGGTIVSGGTSADDNVLVDWNLPGVKSIYVNYTNANGCSGATSTTVTGSTGTIPVIAGPTAACAQSANHLYTTQSNQSDYVWSVIGGNISSGGTLNDDQVTITWTTPGIGKVLVNFTDINGCSAASETVFPVTVHTLPTATIGGATSVCLNSASPLITFTGSNGSAPYTFFYNINGGAPQTITTVSGNSIAISVPTSIDGTFTYNLISVSDANSCSQTQLGNAAVIVNELPMASILGNNTVCLNTPANITFTGTHGTAPFTFYYRINGGAVQTISTVVGNSIVLAANTSSAGTFEYTLQQVTDANGCSIGVADTISIVVNPLPTATISGSTSVCIFAGQPEVTFMGSNGTAPYTFYYRINGGSLLSGTSTGSILTVSAPTNTSGTFIYTLESVTDASSTSCNQPQSGSVTITVTPASVGGVLSGSTNVCTGVNSTLLTVGGYTGAIYDWEYSTDGGGVWSSIGFIGNTYTVTNLVQTTQYRVVVKSGNCAEAFSTVATITVTPATLGGAVTSDATVCASANSGSLSLSGYVGSVLRWESSTNGGVTWTNIANTTAFLNYTNLNSTTIYRALVSNSPCSVVYSSIATITVNARPTGVLSGTAQMCIGTGTNLTLTVTGNGSISGTLSGGISFSGIAPTIIIPVNPVTNTTYTISSLSDDNCTALPVNLSGSATITVNPLPTAFTITPSSVTICEGAIQALTAVGGAPVNGSKTAASGNINVNIPDKSLFGATGVLTRTLNISGIPVNAVITSIVVTYRISHTATGDLNINLKAPNGNILNLVNQRGGTGDDFNTTTISSLSSTPITTGSNPYNNTYAADAKNAIGSPANQSNVTNFAGLYGVPNGTYTLIVEDDVLYRSRFQTNTGKLNHWNITVNYTVPSTLNSTWSPLTGLFSDAGGTVAYLGQNLTTVYTSPSAGAHVYTATFTNSNGCSNTSNVNVNVNPSPQVTISADYCAIPGKIQLTASATPAPINYIWSTGETTQTIEVDEVGVYDVTVTAATGCMGNASIGVAQELVVNGDFELGDTGFFTEYDYATGFNLWPEGEYAVDDDAHLYHTNFYGRDHTTPAQTGNFMMINGSTSLIGNPARPRIIWQQTVNVLPFTDYYFSAWAMNLNPASPAKLQFEINGIAVGTIADLSTAPKPTNNSQVNINNWIRFYSNPTWNSGTNTTAIIKIVNLNTVAGGNDFGLDDISFGTLRPFISLISAPGTDAQTVCANSPIDDIIYAAASGAAGPTVTGLPVGVTSIFNGSTLTISGTPTVPGSYGYTVSTTGTCNPTTVTGTITVQHQTISLAAGSGALSTCVNQPIIPVQFTLGGTATGATVTGLPAGVTGTVSGNILTISGTPTATGLFSYLVTTVGTCTPVTANGSIEVKSQTIGLFSGSVNQTRCVNTAITNIVFQIGGTATGASVSGLPAGVNGNYSGGLFVINGTPTVSGIYNYTVTTSGSCNPTTKSGTLTINPAAAIVLSSASGSDYPTLCINTALTDITYAISGGGTGATISGLPAGLTGTYSSGIFTISGTPTVRGVFNYTVHTTGTCAQTTATGTITVQGSTVALSSGQANQTVCNNTSINNIVFNIGGTGTGATVSGLPSGVTGVYSGGQFTISGTPTQYGTFAYTIVATGSCDGETAGGVLTVGIGSVGGTLPDVYACNNGGGMLMLSGQNGNVVRWEKSIDGGTSWTNIANITNVLTFSNITAPVLYRVMVKQGSCPAVYSNIATSGVLNMWTGAVNNDWFTAANWSNNTLPSMSCSDVIIPSVVAPAVYPVLASGTASVKNIIIHSGASLTMSSGTMEISGTITNNGIFNAKDGTIHLNGNTAQTIPANTFVDDDVNHLLIGNSSLAGVTLAGSLNILGSLNFSSLGTKFATGGFLTLRSTADNTAWVGNLTGKTITGEVTVERYIHTGTGAGMHPKSWQLLAVPTKGSQTIKQAWQEGATFANQNLRSGYGTMITSKIQGALGLGFDAYTPAGGTMNKYDAITNQWVGVATTASTPIENKNGYMVLVRGDRSVITSSGVPNSTTMRTRGKLFTPGADAPPSINVAAGKFESVGNPYASAIDLTSSGVYTHHLADVYYLWDPQLTNQGANSAYGLGAYQTLTKGMDGNYHVTPGGGSYGAPGSVHNTIESGQAFFVISSGQAGHIDFDERAKVPGSNLRSRSSLLTESEIRANIYVMNNGYQVLLDGVATQFNAQYNNEVNVDDALKLGNLSETFSLKRDNKLFAVEKRAPVTASDTIYYNLGLMRSQSYVLEINPANMDATGLSAWLEDLYLHTSTSISLESSTSYPFTVTTSAPESYAANRFRIVFRQVTSPEPEVLIITATAVRRADATIHVSWNVLNESGVSHYEVERSSNRGIFTGILTREALLNNGGEVRYSDIDHNPMTGDNYYRIKAVTRSGKIFYSKTVQVVSKQNGGVELTEMVTVYPNPVMGRQMNVRFENMESGKYKVALYNNSGVRVIEKEETIKQPGLTLRYMLNHLTPGSYRLVVYNMSGKKWTQQVVIL